MVDRFWYLFVVGKSCQLGCHSCYCCVSQLTTYKDIQCAYACVSCDPDIWTNSQSIPHSGICCLLQEVSLVVIIFINDSWYAVKYWTVYCAKPNIFIAEEEEEEGKR
jgi:hypothetical protein